MNASFLQDDSGNNSSMRLASIFALVLALCVWAMICWQKKDMVSLDPTIFALIVSLFGMKVYQKKDEIKAVSGEQKQDAPAV